MVVRVGLQPALQGGPGRASAGGENVGGLGWTPLFDWRHLGLVRIDVVCRLTEVGSTFQGEAQRPITRLCATQAETKPPVKPRKSILRWG